MIHNDKEYQRCKQLASEQAELIAEERKTLEMGGWSAGAVARGVAPMESFRAGMMEEIEAWEREHPVTAEGENAK